MFLFIQNNRPILGMEIVLIMTTVTRHKTHDTYRMPRSNQDLSPSECKLEITSLYIPSIFNRYWRFWS